MQAHTTRQPLHRERKRAMEGRQSVSKWRRGIGRLELAVRAKATGDEPLQIKRIEQRRSQIGLALMSCARHQVSSASWIEEKRDSEFNMRV